MIYISLIKIIFTWDYDTLSPICPSPWPTFSRGCLSVRFAVAPTADLTYASRAIPYPVAPLYARVLTPVSPVDAAPSYCAILVPTPSLSFPAILIISA